MKMEYQENGKQRRARLIQNIDRMNTNHRDSDCRKGGIFRVKLRHVGFDKEKSNCWC